MTETITSTFRRDANWLIGTVSLNGQALHVEAKVYEEPSGYGMPEDARISKLGVSTATRTWLYNYDRGLDVNHLTAEGLALIVAEVAKAI